MPSAVGSVNWTCLFVFVNMFTSFNMMRSKILFNSESARGVNKDLCAKFSGSQKSLLLCKLISA